MHSVGGWAALAGTILLGPRLGKYMKGGQIKPILGHNMPLAALGVFILWLGWFGFNPGSTTAANKDIAVIFVNTNLAAGIFNMGGTSLKIIGVQLLGIGACFLWVFPTAFLMFKLIDKTVGLRVSPEEEMEGLDLAEHGGNAYPDFGVSSYSGVGFSGGPGSPGISADAVGQLKPVKQT